MSEETKTQPTAASEPINTGINFNDFILIQNIIALASRRGAFESKEFSIIGNLTDRLNAFIEANSPIEESNEANDPGQLELPLDYNPE